MWTLKNSSTLLSNIQAQNITKVDYISSWDFSTFYNTVPHQEHKDTIRKHLLIETVHLLMFHQVKHFSLHNLIIIFLIKWQFIEALTLLMDHFYVKPSVNIYQQTVGIPNGYWLCSSFDRSICYTLLNMTPLTL